MTTDLEARMRVHTPGQVTWPDLTQLNWCSTCRLFTGKVVSTGRLS